MSVLDSFDDWKKFLGDRLQRAENKGMDQDKIANMATEIGGYLQDHVDPKNGEERVLSDLWKSASDDEKHALASSMVKMVQNSAKEDPKQ
ncbi:MAG TPA: DUF3243 domain-containing protein [Bacillales bacterium]